MQLLLLTLSSDHLLGRWEIQQVLALGRAQPESTVGLVAPQFPRFSIIRFGSRHLVWKCAEVDILVPVFNRGGKGTVLDSAATGHTRVLGPKPKGVLRFGQLLRFAPSLLLRRRHGSLLLCRIAAAGSPGSLLGHVSSWSVRSAIAGSAAVR